MKKIFSILAAVVAVFSLASCNEVKDPEIKVYTRDTTSGTRDGFFTTIDFKDAVADNTKLVSTYVEAETNGDMINYLKNDKYGIGYISLSSLADSTLKGLKYEGVIPTEENVNLGTYKLTRNFNYCVREEFDNDKERQIVEAFVAYLSTKNAKTTIKQKDGILPEIDSTVPTWDSIKGNYPICNEDNSSITIRFGGSTSCDKIAKALSQEFSLKCGNFKIEHDHTGSGDAYKRTQGSEKDGANKLHIAYASREFKLTSDEPCAQGTYAKMCVDAIVIAVNSNNSIDAITKATAKSIYSGEITKWSEIE